MLNLILNAKKYRYATKIFVLMLTFTLFYMTSGAIISYGCTLGIINNAIALKSIVSMLFGTGIIGSLIYFASKNNNKKTA